MEPTSPSMSSAAPLIRRTTSSNSHVKSGTASMSVSRTTTLAVRISRRLFGGGRQFEAGGPELAGAIPDGGAVLSWFCRCPLMSAQASTNVDRCRRLIVVVMKSAVRRVLRHRSHARASRLAEPCYANDLEEPAITCGFLVCIRFLCRWSTPWKALSCRISLLPNCGVCRVPHLV